MPVRPSVAESASLNLLRGTARVFVAALVTPVIWFVGVTAAVILGGVAYTLLAGKRLPLDVRAIPAWFLHLSRGQWIGLTGATAVALLLVWFPCSRIVHRSTGKSQSPLQRMIAIVGVMTVLLIYAAGARTAYGVSLALGDSRDWAIIHGVYSWAYVGLSFSSWMTTHWKQPVGKTIRQFLGNVR
jgi:hypothetical protein